MQAICILVTLALLATTLLAADEEAPFLSALQAPSTILPEDEIETEVIEDSATEETLMLEIPDRGSESKNPLEPQALPSVLPSAPYQAGLGPYPPRAPVESETQSPTEGTDVIEEVAEEEQGDQQPNPGVIQPERPTVVKLVTSPEFVPVVSGPYQPKVQTGLYPAVVMPQV